MKKNNRWEIFKWHKKYSALGASLKMEVNCTAGHGIRGERSSEKVKLKITSGYNDTRYLWGAAYIRSLELK